MVTDDTTVSRPTTVFRAASKAVGVYLIFYLFLSHCFVVWKWSSHEPAPRSSVDAQHQLQASQAQVSQEISHIQGRISRLQEHESHIERLDRQFRAQQAQLQNIRMTLSHNTTTSLLRISQLLQVESLSEFRSPAQIRKSFGNALSELEKDPGIPELQTLLLDDTKHRRQPVPPCTPVPRLTRHPHAHFPVQEMTTNARLQNFLQSQIEYYRQQQHHQQQSSLPHERSPDCLDDDWELVDDWMEAGLAAVRYQTDIRQALVEASSDDSIILDADLVAVARPPRRRLTLRDVVDRRSLHVALRGLDTLLDAVAGIHALDELLDPFVYRHVPEHVPVSTVLGEFLVQQAARIPLPAAAARFV